jgi:hypothetical protein
MPVSAVPPLEDGPVAVPPLEPIALADPKTAHVLFGRENDR